MEISVERFLAKKRRAVQQREDIRWVGEVLQTQLAAFYRDEMAGKQHAEILFSFPIGSCAGVSWRFQVSHGYRQYGKLELGLRGVDAHSRTREVESLSEGRADDQVPADALEFVHGMLQRIVKGCHRQAPKAGIAERFTG